MGATQFNLKPADITANLDVLSNLLERQKLCSDSEGKLAIDDKWIFVSLRRKFSGLDVSAIEVTFQKAIEFLRQEGSDEVSLKNTITEIKEKMNDAVNVGLVRQFKAYLPYEKKDNAIRFAKLILSTVEQYNKLNPVYSIILNKKVKEQIDDVLIEETLKKALVPAAPLPPPKKKEKVLKDNVVKAVIDIPIRTRVTPGFVMLDGIVSLRQIGQVIEVANKKNSQTQLFDQRLIERAQNQVQEEGKPVRRKKGKAPVEQPVDTSLIDKLAQIRKRVEPAAQDA